MSNPKLYITPKAIATIKAYARNCEQEISGWASMNNKGVIDRVFPLLDQQVSGSDTEMDESALEEFVRSGQSKTANVWWHTHGKLSCFWSSTDDHNISELLRFFPFLISVETNNEAETFIARVDYRLPIRFRQDCDLTVLYNLPKLNEDDIKKEIKQRVKPRTYKVHGPSEFIRIPQPEGLPINERDKLLTEHDFFGHPYYSEGIVGNNGKGGVRYRYGRIVHVPSLNPSPDADIPEVKDETDEQDSHPE
jgi:proteasome lid subunit RPN8/RPN11